MQFYCILFAYRPDVLREYNFLFRMQLYCILFEDREVIFTLLCNGVIDIYLL